MSYGETDLENRGVLMIGIFVFSLLAISIILGNSGEKFRQDKIEPEIIRIKTFSCEDVKNYMLYELPNNGLNYNDVKKTVTNQYSIKCLGLMPSSDLETVVKNTRMMRQN